MRLKLASLSVLLLAGYTTVPKSVAPIVQAPVEVQILAFNDFHGNLETPPVVEITNPDGSKQKIVTGGAAHLAAALAGARSGQANTVTVSAGDTVVEAWLTRAKKRVANAWLAEHQASE